MNYPASLKAEWDAAKRNRFQQTLQQRGWTAIKFFKRSTLFSRGTKQIEVDSFGAFLFEYSPDTGGFVRTHGVSDDRIDEIYSPGRDSSVLLFKHNRTVRRLSLETAEWVRQKGRRC